MKFSIAQLRLANELCYPADFVRLANKHLPEEIVSGEIWKFLNAYNHNLLFWIFHFSRAELRRGMGDILDAMVLDILGETPA